MTDFLWLYILVLLAGMWNGVARELRNGLLGYLIQTLLIAILYISQALRFHDSGMWIAFAGLVAVRGVFIPLLLVRKLPTAMIEERQSRYVLNPTYMIFIFIGISLLALGATEVSGGSLSASFGAALATLIVGLAAATFSHDAGKQILGLLTADNGTDLAIVTILQRVSVVGDYVVFLDIALAMVVLVVLLLKLRQAGSLAIEDYHELKG